MRYAIPTPEDDRREQDQAADARVGGIVGKRTGHRAAGTGGLADVPSAPASGPSLPCACVTPASMFMHHGLSVYS